MANEYVKHDMTYLIAVCAAFPPATPRDALLSMQLARPVQMVPAYDRPLDLLSKRIAMAYYAMLQKYPA